MLAVCLALALAPLALSEGRPALTHSLAGARSDHAKGLPPKRSRTLWIQAGGVASASARNTIQSAVAFARDEHVRSRAHSRQ